MSDGIPSWRDHYLELLAEGERLKLSGSVLGDWIAHRMTPAELRAALADYYIARAALEPAAGPPTRPEVDQMSDTAWDRLEWAAEAVLEAVDNRDASTAGIDPLWPAFDQLRIAVAEVQAERAGGEG